MTILSDNEPFPEKVGPYPIQRRLGRGAMAEVFEGYDSDHSRRIAIKVLSEDLASDKDAIQRIERESRILELIHNPHVVHLYGHGRAEDGRPYLVFELVAGHTLAEIIDDHHQPDWATGLKWMHQAAEALDEAWKNHVIHRDIKPGNMIIDAHGNLRLLDFGLAKALHATDDDSKRRILLGTPRYISPEMGLGQSLDYRADMYSLGATFYHYFVGQAPFDAPSLMALVMAHANQPLLPPHSIDPNLPHDICDILEKLLQKEPARRYQDYGDLIADLREARLALISKNGAFEPSNEFNPVEQGTPSLADPRVASVSSPQRKIELRSFEARSEVTGLPSPRNSHQSLAWILFALAAVTMLVVFMLIQQGMSDGKRVTDKRQGISMPKIRLLEPLNAPKVRAAELLPENRDRMQRIMSVIIRYEIQHGQLPASLDQLISLDLASDELVLDAWGNRFDYDNTTGNLLSSGADGEAETRDDFVMDLNLKFAAQSDDFPTN